MAHYMTMLKFAAGGYAETAADGPQRRAKVLRGWAKSMGAEIEGLWYGTGEWDLIMVTKGELDASTLASYWTALSDGRFESAVTFPVFDPDELQSGFDQLDTDGH